MKIRMMFLMLVALGIGMYIGLLATSPVQAGIKERLLKESTLAAMSMDVERVSEAQLILMAKNDNDKDKVGNGGGSDKPDLRYVDWSQASSVKKKTGSGNGNGNNGDEEEEDEVEKAEEEEEGEEGFDRLWDVVLYG